MRGGLVKDDAAIAQQLQADLEQEASMTANQLFFWGGGALHLSSWRMKDQDSNCCCVIFLQVVVTTATVVTGTRLQDGDGKGVQLT